MTRSEILDLDDRGLLALCRQETYRGSGPGGQHRNTTDSAVRLTIEAEDVPEVVAESTNRRSQHENRRIALERLRRGIAEAWRLDTPPDWDGQWKMNTANPDYPKLMAVMLDALAQNDYAVGDAARALGLSTGRFSRLLWRDPDLWALANQEREARGHRPLRSPE